MARNQVQFQKGLGTAEFMALYGTEELCHEALVKMRWPDGFVCPKCATAGTASVRRRSFSNARPVTGKRRFGPARCSRNRARR